MILMCGVISKAQYYGFVAKDVCWDSLGTEVELYALNFHVINNTEGEFLGYFNRKGEIQSISDESKISDGRCGNSSTTQTEIVDTAIISICVQVTSFFTDGSTTYEKGDELSHFIKISKGNIVAAYFINPITSNSVTVPALSIEPCNQFKYPDFSDITSQGIEFTVPASSQVTISPPGVSRVFNIICDPSRCEQIEGTLFFNTPPSSTGNYPIQGNRMFFLESWAHNYHQKWEDVNIDSVEISNNSSSNCKCIINWSNERTNK